MGEGAAEGRTMVLDEQLARGPSDQLLRGPAGQAADRAQRRADPAGSVELEQQAAAGKGEGDEAVPVGAQVALRRTPPVAGARAGHDPARGAGRRPAAAAACSGGQPRVERRQRRMQAARPRA